MGPSDNAATRVTERPPWYRDVRVLRVVVQVGIVAAVAAIAAFLLGNMFNNLNRQGITTGFGYLDQSAEFTIPGSSFDRTDSRLAAILVGVGNTFRVAFAGIILATIIGVLLGISRLSKNWLLSTGARVYVEFFRNIPLLVIIIFAYLAVFLRLPRVEDAYEPLGLTVVSVRGVYLPWYEGSAGFAAFVIVVLAAIVGSILVYRYRYQVQDRRGTPAHPVIWGTVTFAVVVIAAFVALGGPVDVTVPGFEAADVVGGIRLSPEYAALLVALVLYTASHIAEITRASIQAVPKGQVEASSALALSGYQRMRHVILPQAFRVAIPPLANQYLNLTKNSSLAVAVSYFELTKVTNDIIANGAPAPQSFALLMAFYLVISLAIAALTNFANRRLALVER